MKKLFSSLLNTFFQITRKKRKANHFNIFTILIIASSFNFSTPQQTTAQVGISFQIFYDELSPYGSWINNAEYGYVWRPSYRNNFFPYGNNGYWIYTEMGWSWVSNYPWGWAPFHYGRWLYDPFYGWVWVPGYEWAPAWVTWRECPGYYGWAPLGPDISFDIAFGSGYYVPYDRWRFVPQRDFGRRDIDRHFAGIGGYAKYLEQSYPINNVHHVRDRDTRYHAGPQIREVEKVTGKGFVPVIIKSLETPKQKITKRELQIFRPEIKRSPTENSAPKIFQQWYSDKPKKEAPIKNLPQKIVHEPIRELPSREELPPQQPKEIRQQPAEERFPKIDKQPRDIRHQPAEQGQPPKEQPRQERPFQQQVEQRQPVIEKIQKEQPVQQPREQPQKQERQPNLPPQRNFNNRPIQDKLQPVRKPVPEKQTQPERPPAKRPSFYNRPKQKNKQ